jgi:hypothetical protein
MSPKFTPLQPVRVKATGQKGAVEARAIYRHAKPQYLVIIDGERNERWYEEEELEGL